MLSFRDLLCFNAISVLSRFTHFCVDRKWTQHSCLWSKYDVWVFCVGRITFKNIFTLWTLLGRNIFALFCCRDLPENSSESFLLQGFAWKFFWKFSAAGMCLKILLVVIANGLSLFPATPRFWQQYGYYMCHCSIFLTPETCYLVFRVQWITWRSNLKYPSSALQCVDQPNHHQCHHVQAGGFRNGTDAHLPLSQQPRGSGTLDKPVRL